jgi:hypothetical protein
MALALKRTTSPVVGWRKDFAANSAMRAASSPDSGGVANSWPMI